jgi:hypothetical protein
MVKGRFLLLVYALAVISVLALYAYAASLPTQEGDGNASVQDILSDPETYRGEQVYCIGTMIDKEESYDSCEFLLEDGDYSMRCIAESAFPMLQDNAMVKVSGFVSYSQHQGYWYIDVTNVIEQ